MSSAHPDAMMKLSQERAEACLHAANSMAMNAFGPAAEHPHIEVAGALGAAMVQHEGSQITADAFRAAEGQVASAAVQVSRVQSLP